MWVTWVILNLLLAVFGVSDEVIPAVELMADHWELGVHVGLETAPHPAALGRQVQLCIARERVKLALSCTTAGVTKRRAYTPHCLGKTKTPSVQQMKSAVVKRATEHTVGKTHHVGQSTTVVLSPEQLTRGRELRMPELIGDEPAPDRRTV
ncbi:unnamed protein product, partial [Pylaiella littoralis]